MVSLVLGIIGSVIGLICSIAAFFNVSLSKIFHATTTTAPVTTDPITTATVHLGASLDAWGALFFSILALFGSFFFIRHPKIGGTLIIICAIGGFSCITTFYILPGIFFIIAGLIGYCSKRKDSIASKE